MQPHLPDLNYHHLRYFWAVVRSGSIARACDELHVAQPTISGQLKELEQAVGTPLLVRSGRGLRPTDTGRLVMRYCDEIFSLGRELQEALARGGAADAPVTVGVADSLPKLVVGELLGPAFPGAALVCVDGEPARLFAALAGHDLDVVLSDVPCEGEAGRGAVFNHQLGDSGVAIFAPAALAGLAAGFPGSLTGQPMVLPTPGVGMRRDLDAWFERHGVRPQVVAEVQDAALLKTLAAARGACFPAHLVVAGQVAQAYGATPLGECAGLRERFWAVSVERRLTNPAVLAITQGARKILRRV